MRERERERKGKMINYISIKKKPYILQFLLTYLLHTQIRAVAKTATKKTTATMETMTEKHNKTINTIFKTTSSL